MAGRTIVVTRTRAQAASLAGRLEGLGATVVELPVIAIDGPADKGAALAQAAARLASGAYAWVALTSSNAADRLLAALGDETVPGQVRWAAVGTGTAATLAAAGITAELVPTVATADSLANSFPAPRAPEPVGPDDPVATGAKVLFPRAETVRGGLAAGLRAKGWDVDDVVAYRTVAGDPSPGAVRSARRADAVAFTSSSAVERTIELLGAGALPRVVVTIGPVTSSSARAAGLTIAAEAEPHTLDGLVAALTDVLRSVGAAPSESGTGPRLP
jgi:uroporphyrinogen-III synthase